MDIEKAIEYQKEIRTGFRGPSDEVCDFTIKALEELQQYRQIGTIDECRVAREKQIPKEPKRIYKKYGKHKWIRKENGEIDECAFDFGIHSGVVCEVCGESFCVLCNPDYDELNDCEEEYFLCPNCGEKLYGNPVYCNCGQALKWED